MMDADLPVLRLLRARLDAPRDDESAFQSGIIAAVGDTLGWLVGTLWLADPATARLHASSTWVARWHDGTVFVKATRLHQFARGEGLPGRVWASGEPEWITDVTLDPTFMRVEAARQEGLRSGIGIPLVDRDGGTPGVLEFFTDQFRSPLALLLEVFREIGRVAGPAFGAHTGSGRPSATPRPASDRHRST
jgi:GAF domain-containing protein